jgi:hypothetical protein
VRKKTLIFHTDFDSIKKRVSSVNVLVSAN